MKKLSFCVWCLFITLITASGCGGAVDSSVYLVAHQYSVDMTATLAEPGVVDSIMVNNTTYAYLSMRDGDDYAKKFGGECRFKCQGAIP